MKRILSLILVLVMLIGVMPMALAGEEEEEKELSEGGSVSVSAPGTLQVGDSASVSLTGFTTAGGTNLEDKLGSVSLSLSSSDSSVVSVSGTTITGVAAGDATITATATFVGNKINKGTTTFNVTVEGAEEEPVSYVVAAASDLDLLPGETGSAVPTITPAPAEDVEVKIEYSSSKTSVATVSDSGSVTAVAEGEAVITAVVTIGSNTPVEAKTTVNVSGVKILCAEDGKSYPYSSAASATLKPALSEDVDGTVTWTFVIDTNTANATGAQNSDKLTLDPAKPGIVKVKITASWGENKSVEKTVSVSFYDTVDAEVTVANGITAFLFDDTKVFSSVKIDGKSVAASGHAMTTLWAGVNFDDVKLLQKDRPSSVGEISYSASGVNNAFIATTSNTYSKLGVNKLKFTCLSRGEFVLYYDLLDEDLPVRSGTITVHVNEGGSDIEYKTSFNKSITFDEKDFEQFWAASSNKSKLDYVFFTPSSTIGDLYTNGTDKVLVTSRHEFHNKFNSSTDNGVYDYDLDLITYVPYKNVTKSYSDVISFTCVGEDFSETLSGVVTITVGQMNPFKDVKESDYFYDAVMWAVEEEITTGTSATTFSPDQVCTRGQVVTFLWRAAGEPTPKTTVNPFTDVKKDDFYYKAVLWAYEKGITTGITATTFGPNQAITRSQAVTFLYRYNNEPAVTGTNSFVDVSSTAYYDDAVTWAVKNGITNGMSATKFAPNDGCTRAQIVTFLYRDAE